MCGVWVYAPAINSVLAGDNAPPAISNSRSKTLHSTSKCGVGTRSVETEKLIFCQKNTTSKGYLEMVSYSYQRQLGGGI